MPESLIGWEFDDSDPPFVVTGTEKHEHGLSATWVIRHQRDWSAHKTTVNGHLASITPVGVEGEPVPEDASIVDLGF